MWRNSSLVESEEEIVCESSAGSLTANNYNVGLVKNNNNNEVEMVKSNKKL